MTTEVKLAVVIKGEGKIARLTKSRKYHRCGVCQDYIYKGLYYWAITTAGRVLGGIKFPEKVHPRCLNDYFEKIKRSREL